MTIDWSRPIEVIGNRSERLDAKVVRVSEYYVDLFVNDQVEMRFTKVGGFCGAWFARNKFCCPPMNDEWLKGMGLGAQNRPNPSVPEHPTPTQYAPELVERMMAFFKDYSDCPSKVGFGPQRDKSAYAETLAIIADLPQEVDPDLILARECLMEVNGGSPYTEAGDDDGTPAVRAALAAIKKLKTVA